MWVRDNIACHRVNRCICQASPATSTTSPVLKLLIHGQRSKPSAMPARLQQAANLCAHADSTHGCTLLPSLGDRNPRPHMCDAMTAEPLGRPAALHTPFTLLQPSKALWLLLHLCPLQRLLARCCGCTAAAAALLATRRAARSPLARPTSGLDQQQRLRRQQERGTVSASHTTWRTSTQQAHGNSSAELQ